MEMNMFWICAWMYMNAEFPCGSHCGHVLADIRMEDISFWLEVLNGREWQCAIGLDRI